MHTVTCRKLLPFIDPLCSKAGRNVRLRHGVDAPDLGGLPVTRRRLVKRKFGGGEQQQRQQQLPQHRERQQQLPRQRERQQAISPLPYWCEAVTVVGLPKDEIVFCFHTFTEAAATARRELRPEGWYGATAVKLAGMPSSKVSDILDRWQYACARQELAELDCRPMLWWRYHAAVRGLAKNAAARGAASNGSARLNRRQRRLAAQMAEEAQALVQVEAPVHHTAAGSSSSSASRSSDASAGSPNGCTNGGISVDKGWLDAAEQVQQHDGQQQDEFEQAGMPPKVHPKPQGKEQEPRAGQQAEIKENQQQKELQQATDQPHAAEQQQDERNLEQQERQEEQRQASAKLQPVLGSALAETSISGSCGMAATTKLLAALAGIAAAAAHVGAVLLRLPWTVWSAAVSACLGLYRRLLPVWFRRLFWQSWPPRVVEAHVSPSLAAFLADPACSEARLRAGFNAAGQCSSPLADLPRWRIEALTLSGVRDMDLYRTALTHKMALPPTLRLEKSYERLEFLGDSVLGLTCRTLLMRRLPARAEGDMTRQNSRLVSGASNARRAEWLSLDRYLLLDPRGLGLGEQHKPGILSDAFEALLGALFLDQGFDAAQRFCVRVLDACVEWDEVEGVRDYKALLCRTAALRHKRQPRFLVRSLGRREYKGCLQLTWWHVDVALAGRIMGSGGSFDKRDAEQVAARCALERMGEIL
ncbi:hypothetical protein D9Q98_002096 [Chlorella vulgaris]|uniref:Uncharacterized protein n=1 Tax=Chlorella vulgaris TaxID=3077 RepID=A0A9D4TVT4_CHLVU|nr:hypothetical protein D9Q98_002096 [Chlorella vulgaris]